MTADLAALIIRGLSGQHLHDWLPGQDNRAAIAAAVTSRHEWSGSGYARVTGDGIGEWPTVASSYAARRSDAVLFVTWAEVLEVVERGCADGHRERYEAAAPGSDAMRDAKAALIRHGCEADGTAPLVQGELFELTGIAA